eukprot:CAMPEP_0177386646 /NCGR_PEP_ID=MMETSP0368-20130122/50910_1 /TAXON_ID=447022 ORGANISM="Scrippsiella hangoei-like, Strain SHHI-4" /NCGR_SAMPLE_ID=MMETSP0368 /ASSEMBLY_ACC=CAM_ASM_000363 /LENGTH=452 /DNA_ID=CAMNT_0018851539 /DNA_START=51 /DNA_END=1409 /DNA_ORIENTATION=+
MDALALLNLEAVQGALGRTESDPPPSPNIYVWQLPAEATDDFLKELFQQCGNVLSVKAVPGKRYGFVRFSTTEEAVFALQAVNGLACHGTTLKVKFADNTKGAGKGKAGPAGGFGDGGGLVAAAAASIAAMGGAPPLPGRSGGRVESDAEPCDNVYVWQLPHGSDDGFLQQLFQQVGTVVSVKCMPEKRYGFVRFGSVDDASLAIQAIHGLQCHGTILKVKFADNPKGLWSGVPGLAGDPSPISQLALGAAGASLNGGAAAPASAAAAGGGVDIGVEGLPAAFLHADIKQLFDLYCTSTSCKVVKNDASKTYAVVNVGNRDEVMWLMANLNGNIPQGLEAPIWITELAAPPPKAGGGMSVDARSSPYSKGGGKDGMGGFEGKGGKDGCGGKDVWGGKDGWSGGKDGWSGGKDGWGGKDAWKGCGKDGWKGCGKDAWKGGGKDSWKGGGKSWW